MPTINIPSFKEPSGTVWNDVVTFLLALAALLKALGVIG